MQGQVQGCYGLPSTPESPSFSSSERWSTTSPTNHILFHPDGVIVHNDGKHIWDRMGDGTAWHGMARHGMAWDGVMYCTVQYGNKYIYIYIYICIHKSISPSGVAESRYTTVTSGKYCGFGVLGVRPSSSHHPSQPSHRPCCWGLPFPVSSFLLSFWPPRPPIPSFGADEFHCQVSIWYSMIDIYI